MTQSRTNSNWSTRRRQAAERRTQIIDAVLRLVDEYGVQGTTTARIAAAIGVTEPTLYTYFENRRDMLLAALDVLFDRAEDMMGHVSGADSIERLRNLARQHTQETAARRLGFVNPLFEFLISPREIGLRERARERRLAVVKMLQTIVEEGQAEGSIRQDVDARRVAWKILAFYWFEDMSSMMDHGEVVEGGISSEMFDHLIAQIAS